MKNRGPFKGGETVQLWRCGCEGDVPYGTPKPPGPTRCLSCGVQLEKSRMFTLPPKPDGAVFFHWGRKEWVNG